MYKNNFDVSSTGTNIELTCFHDSHESQSLWDDNFEVLQFSSYSKTGKFYYIDCGNVPDSDSIEFKLKGSDKDMRDYLTKEGYDAEDIETWIQNGVADYEIINGFSDSPDILNYQDINKYDLADTGLEIVPDKNIVWVSIHGYSQGDYAEVCYCPDDLEKVWGNKPNESDLKETFTHLFYDAPIYAKFVINGEEYNYCDMSEYDEYDWKAEEFAEYVSKESGIDKEVIQGFLPDYPDYR